MLIIKIIKTLWLISWMAFIFLLSNIPGDALAAPTNSIESVLVHFLLYFALAVFFVSAALSWKEEKNISRRLAPTAIIFCVFYGITDEYHQGFVVGRDASFIDLSFDALGAALGVALYYFARRAQKPKLLLHICCAGCGAYIGEQLKENYNVALFYYNPNIYPPAEYGSRLAEAKKIAEKFGLRLIAGEYDHSGWLEKVKGREADPERGERCRICYQDRLEETARVAREGKYDCFVTTLTASPHKDAQAIINIGKELSRQYGVQFLENDFKKQDGFKKSARLSKELGLYRQNYCGCEYSYKFTN